jgi:uncharacterized protein (TIGR02996 family)
MESEADFLRMVLAQPEDDGLRLAYADWLEEQGDPVSADKAEFLRLTAGTADPKRLQALAAALDTGWLAVVSKLAVENCPAAREAKGKQQVAPVRFDFLCERHWDDMTPTADPAVRFCEGCRQKVYYCDTIMEARDHAGDGHCVAVDLGILRRQDDLRGRMLLRGKISREASRREEERLRPDLVSAERDQRKRAKKE